MTTADTIMRRYVPVGERQVHYRVCGEGPAVVLLHDSPRSSRLHTATMKMLASRFQVFALDTPGYGSSEPLGLAEATIPDFAQALGEALTALGLEGAPLYATHTSAKIALALAARGGTMPLLVLDGLAIPDGPAPEDFIAAYMRPFRPDPAGAYLASEWVRVRDMLRWFPWFSHKRESRMAIDTPNAEWLADYAADLFSAGPHYSDAYAAAMRWSPKDDLLAVTVPTCVAARSDDVLVGFLDKVPVQANPALTVERLGTDRGEWLEWLAAKLESAAGVVAPAPKATPATAPFGYTDLPEGQLHWRYRPGSAGRTLLILSAPTTLEAHGWAEALAGERPTLVPDLPGFGLSDPLARPDANGLADALAALVRERGLDQVDVLALGLAAPLGAALAARHPEVTATLAIHGAPPLDGAPSEAERYCPPLAFDPQAGTHLHSLWHILRDGQVQWPWFDGSAGAARKDGVLADATSMHAALTGTITQLASYGEGVTAALAAASRAHWQRVTIPVLVSTGEDPSQHEAEAIAALLPGGQTLALPVGPAEAAPLLACALDALRKTCA